MTITNFDLIQIYNLLESCGSKKFPQKISFAITKNLIDLKAEVDIYQQALQKLFQSYDSVIIKKEDGTPELNEQGVPKVKEEERVNFEHDLLDLLNTEVDIKFYQIDQELFNYDDDRFDILTPQDMFNLQKVLCKQEKKEDN